jgi:hypothetical protein
MHGIDSEKAGLDRHMDSLVKVPALSGPKGPIGTSRGSSDGVSRLHPADIQALAAAVSNVQLDLDGRNVSRSVDRRLGQMR